MFLDMTNMDAVSTKCIEQSYRSADMFSGHKLLDASSANYSQHKERHLQLQVNAFFWLFGLSIVLQNFYVPKKNL